MRYFSIITFSIFLLSGCSNIPKNTLSGEPLKMIPDNVKVPPGVVLIAAVCMPDKNVILENSDGIRYGKIFKKGFSVKKMKLGYPEKINNRYWIVEDLGEIDKIKAFVMPNTYGKNQRLSMVWNLRDRDVGYDWTPWLLPDYKIEDISNYSKAEWGLVGADNFMKSDDKSNFLVKFRLISYYMYILEQINHWNLYSIEHCVPEMDEKNLKLKNLKVDIEEIE